MYASKDGCGFWRAFLIALMFQFFLFGLCITLFPYVRGYIVDRAIEGDARSLSGADGRNRTGGKSPRHHS